MSNSSLPIIHHHDYVSTLPRKHRFAMRKFHGVLEYLKRDQVITMKQVHSPDEVSHETAALVHSEEYIHKFFHGLTDAKEQRRTGFVWDEGLARRCRLEAGGTLLSTQLARERGLACNTGGGTHHAFRDYGSGFCLINDMAIAAKYALKAGIVERVLIVDLDVHQGDGTAKILENEECIFTFSMHSAKNFPFEKQKSDLDIALEDGLGDHEYLSILHDHLPSILQSFRPDMVIYDAGVDPHVKDELGKLNLTDQGLFDRDYYVMNECIRRGIPCATVIGGGYSRDLEALSLRHTIVHRAATKLWHSTIL
ncbi:hypothetical protein CAPTEDRAFT_228874 [Capitella teleta]|uniref:Histone deacetylase domain-containing protein n=1 Tax=Capitella teleta TaxID=283909 RepID=R7TN99_CAPTE|nr:hypothetical protein CAPTEDRAFT_228874 [Capitella teleta]|eukprot:ELT95017.1 hypothetical protein CAPTEDRAFT_228874 [Capitella teleta]